MRSKFLTLAAAMLVAPAVAWADEAADTFNSLFGDEVKRVVATPSPVDDVALAKQLLDAAKSAEKQPALLILLCNKAYELGIKDTTGYDTALTAMQLAADKLPDRKIACLAKIAALYQGQYGKARGADKAQASEVLIQAFTNLADAQAAAGDTDAAATTLRQALAAAAYVGPAARNAVQAQLTALLSQQQQEKQLAALKAKLQATPKDDATRKELVRLCLVEMDNPAEAANFVDGSIDEATRKYVPAVAKGLDNTPELACSELGKWYQGLADQASAAGVKTAMLNRAKAYYGRFLELHTTEDLARTADTLALKMVEDALAKIRMLSAEDKTPKSPSTAAKGGWQPMFNGKDLTGWQSSGAWEVEPGGILVGKRGGNLATTARFGDFAMDGEFLLEKGTNSGVYIRANNLRDPIGTGLEIQVFDSFGDPRLTPNTCGGLYGFTAPSKVAVKPPGQWNRMQIAAKGNHVQVVLNGEPVIDTDIPAAKAAQKEGHIVLQRYTNAIRFRNLKIKPL